jgi:hypothetical protein
MKPEELLPKIKEMGNYLDVRMLEDESIVAIGDLMFTRAVYMDVDLLGWGRRFCFEDRTLAIVEFVKLQNGDQEPQGWIARR